MDLDELRAFIAVADTGSFSAAAKSLNFARATLRKRVDELEARSGVQLLKRATDAASVTRAGEILAERGRSLLFETRAIFEAVRSLESQTDRITVEVPAGLPPVIEQTAHSSFRKAAPNVRWRIRYTDGRFNPASDAALMLSFGEPATTESGWEQSRVARVKTGLVASAEYLEKHGTPTTVEELAGHSLLVWERHDRNPDLLPLKHADPIPWPVPPRLLSPSPHLIREFAVSGDGIALAPISRLAQVLGPRGELVPVLKDQVGDQVDVWISARKEALTGPLGVLTLAITKFTKLAFSTFDSVQGEGPLSSRWPRG